MSDILIRDIPESVLASLDESARLAGLSRAEYIRRALTSTAEQDAARRGPKVTVDGLRRLTELCSDLADPEVVEAAWR